MSAHQNDGKCKGCAALFDKFPGFHEGLRSWFEQLQAAHPEAHISCAGRDSVDQNYLLQTGRSKAKFGQSAHNWNAAIDLFVISDTAKSIYDLDWFKRVVEPALNDSLCWYGRAGAPFYELPHVEVADWNAQAHAGQLKLIR